MLAQALARKSQHDEDKVDAEGPEACDERDAHDAAGLEDGSAEPWRGCSDPLSNSDGILTGLQSTGRLSYDVDLADVVFRAREASVLPYTGRNRVVAAVGVVGEGVEPDKAKEGRVERVDDRVERVEVCEQQAFKRRLHADVLVQIDGGDEDHGRVEVHGQLPPVDGGAGQESKQAIQPGHFVDDLEEGDDLGAGAQRHLLEEFLARVSLSLV